MENNIQPNPTPIQQPQVPITPPTDWTKISLFSLLGLIVVAGAVFAGVQIGKGQVEDNQLIAEQPTVPTETIVNPTLLPTLNPTSVPTLMVPSPKPSINPRADWLTYKNEQYKFEFKYPKGGKLEVSQTGYVRIQNYISNDSPGLKSGEYYLEFNLPPSTTTCKNLIVESETINQANGVVYKGLGEVGGDAGGTRFALCAEKPNMNLYLQVTENSQNGTIANQILSTFQLLK